MSQKKTILQGVFFTTSGIALNNIFTLITALLTFRVLGARDMGYTRLAITVFTFCNFFVDLGLGRIFASEMSKKRGEDQPGKVKYYFLLNLKLQTLTIVICMAALLASYHLVARAIGIPDHYMHSVTLYVFLFGIHKFFTNFFNSFLLFFWENMVEVVFFFARFLILLVIHMKNPDNAVFWVLYSYPLAEVATLSVTGGPMLYHAVKRFRGVKTDHTADMGTSLWRQIKFAIMVNVMKSVSSPIPLWLLKFFSGPEAVGLFNCAIRLIQAMSGFIRAMESMLLPLISQFHTESIDKRNLLMRRMTKYSLWMVLALMAGLALCVPWLLRALVKPEYIQSVPYFRVLLVLLFAHVFIQVERPLLITHERQDALFYTDLANTVMIIVLGTPLIYFYDLWGMVAVNVIFKFLPVFMYHYYIKREEPDFRLMDRPFTIDDWDKNNLRSVITYVRTRRRDAL